MSELTPREIVNELDRYIIGQHDAKRAVAIALRNRWRRMQLDPSMRDEVTPKNILMIGPTGVGKTEIARRLGRLEAMLAVADKEASLLISGNGDVLEPEHGLIAIGSGGPYAQSAALALMENTELDARTIVEKALKIAGDICIYTNHNYSIEEL